MENTFKTFLCYNSKDKDFVKIVADILMVNGVNIWIDENDIPVGAKWYPYLFNNIESFHSIIVFIGQNGLGVNQEREVENIIREFEQNNKPIIPVLIPGYSESLHELPKYVKSQLINKHNYVDYEGDKTRATKRLLAGVKGIFPNDIDLNEKDKLEKLPDYQKIISYAPFFKLGWVFLHVTGYLLVNSFSKIVSLEQYFYEFWIITVTLMILFLLLLLGKKLLNFFKIKIDKTGIVVSFFFGIFISYLLVSVTNQLNPIASFSGAATTLGTGIIAGAASRWIVGVVMSIISGIGAFVAAILLPWLSNSVTGFSTVSQNALQVMLIFGTVLWALLLANLLVWIVKNNVRLKNLTTTINT